MATNPVEIPMNYGQSKKDEYGNSDRLDPNDARRFIEDLVMTMKQRSWDEYQKPDTDIVREQDGPSEAKQVYGDTWTLIYGITVGMRLMNSEHEKEFDWEEGKEIDYGISGDDSWQEHYDQYGYGAYGRGLKIGKRLAFYEDRDFSFTSNEDKSEEGQTKFDIE